MIRAVYTFAALCLISSGLEASFIQGKKIYSASCTKCHLYGKAMASSKSAQEWKNLLQFKENSNKLAQLHLNAKEAEASWSYFKDKTYKEEARHLKDFLQKYSSDRGRHNSCN